MNIGHWQPTYLKLRIPIQYLFRVHCTVFVALEHQFIIRECKSLYNHISVFVRHAVKLLTRG
jgi:hypothetical protein